MLIDIHTCTGEEGGPPTIENLIERARLIGLDALCITNLRSLPDQDLARAKGREAGITVLFGAQIQTNRGQFLCFLPDPKELLSDRLPWPTDPKGAANFAQLTAAVHKLEGALVAVAPYDRSLPGAPGDTLAQLENIHAIEVLAGNAPTLSNELAEELALSLGLPGVGGSQAGKDSSNLGKTATLVRGPVATEADLIERLLAGDAWPVSLGKPLLGTMRSDPNRNSSSRPGRGPRTPNDRSSNRRPDRSRGRPGDDRKDGRRSARSPDRSRGGRDRGGDRNRGRPDRKSNDPAPKND